MVLWYIKEEEVIQTYVPPMYVEKEEVCGT